MTKIDIAFQVVIWMNVLMFLSQAAMTNLNPESTEFYDCRGSMLENFDKNKCEGTYSLIDTDRMDDDLPTGEGAISPTTGNFFTDRFSSVKTWFGRNTGLSYVYNILAAPYNLIKATKLPNEFVFAFGALWYSISLLAIVSFFWGGN